jgi:hypothetical protein
MGAADIGPGDTPKQGTVLARLTLRAKAEGVSPSLIYRGDYSGDGVVDFAPTLTGPGSPGGPPQYLGDTNGDTLFDGTISSGQVAIGTGCVTPTPELKPDESAGVPDRPNDEPNGEDDNVVGVVNEEGGDGTTEPGAENVPDPQNPGADASNSGGEAEAAGAETSGNGSEENTDDGRNGNSGPRQATNDGGLVDGIAPWMLISLGVAAAVAGGITFYLIRVASRDPY